MLVSDIHEVKPRRTFVDYGGTLFRRQPYQATNATFFAFLLRADGASIERHFCHNRFNHAGGALVDFEPVSPLVLLTFSSIASLSSLNNADTAKGIHSERECALWVLLRERRQERLFWFQPYVFVDNPYALANGREVYGFPKTFADVRLAERPGDASLFSVTSMAVRRYQADALYEPMELIRVVQSSAPTAGSAATSAQSLGTMLSQAAALLPQPGLNTADFALGARVIEDLLHRRTSHVFLKQFPDAACPGEACYQSIVEAPSVLREFSGGGFLAGSYAVRIAQCDSHPLLNETGLPVGEITPLAAFHAQFSFELGNGVEISRLTREAV